MLAYTVTFFYFDQTENIVKRTRGQEAKLSIKSNLLMMVIYSAFLTLSKAVLQDSRLALMESTNSGSSGLRMEPSRGKAMLAYSAAFSQPIRAAREKSRRLSAVVCRLSPYLSAMYLFWGR